MPAVAEIKRARRGRQRPSTPLSPTIQLSPTSSQFLSLVARPSPQLESSAPQPHQMKIDCTASCESWLRRSAAIALICCILVLFTAIGGSSGGGGGTALPVERLALDDVGGDGGGRSGVQSVRRDGRGGGARARAGHAFAEASMHVSIRAPAVGRWFSSSSSPSVVPASATQSAKGTPAPTPPPLTDEEALLIMKMPAGCAESSLPAAMREYAVWREGKMVFLRAAEGDVKRARELQAASDDTDPPLSVVVYGRAGGGWGDRLPAVVSLLAFAMDSRRVFFLDYPPVYEWLASPYFDWRLDARELPFLVATVAATPVEHLYTCDNWASCLFSTAAPEKRFPPDPPVSLHLVSNRGLWQPTTDPATRARWTALVAGRPACLHQAAARPRAALLQQPEVRLVERRFAAERAKGKRIVGIHHRAGDAIMGNEAAGLRIGSNFTDAAAKVTALMVQPDGATFASENLAVHATNPRDSVFFVTDSLELREAVRALYPAVITTDTQPMHVGNDASDVAVDIAHERAKLSRRSESDGMRDALIDWWLLARTDIRSGWITSGFIRTATVHSYTGEWLQGVFCLDTAQCCGEGLLPGTHHEVIATCFESQSGV